MANKKLHNFIGHWVYVNYNHNELLSQQLI